MRFVPGTLRQRAEEVTARALECGSLLPIETEESLIPQGGVTFMVRMISSLALKALEARRREAAASAGDAPPPNPFLPYDPTLFVADLTDTHLALLNKFPVIDHHVLIVTRQFEDQELLLNRADFEAFWTGLGELGGLGFYNGGTKAGASQPHKHLQIVPLPLSREGPGLPIQPLIESLPPPGQTGRIASFPFRHAAMRLSPGTDADAALEGFLELLREVGLPPPDGARQPGPYNLLMQRDWMLVVPRSRELSREISVNALGYAGSLFVKNRKELERLRQTGPLTLLSEVGVGW